MLVTALMIGIYF